MQDWQNIPQRQNIWPTVVVSWPLVGFKLAQKVATELRQAAAPTCWLHGRVVALLGGWQCVTLWSAPAGLARRVLVGSNGLISLLCSPVDFQGTSGCALLVGFSWSRSCLLVRVPDFVSPTFLERKPNAFISITGRSSRKFVEKSPVGGDPEWGVFAGDGA